MSKKVRNNMKISITMTLGKDCDYPKEKATKH